jgi:nicotinamide-nucleotide amidase
MDVEEDGGAKAGELLEGLGASLAVAESLTGGLLANRFAAAPGASEWFRGGVVSYQKTVKFTVLGVPEGPVVTEDAALAMARGVRTLMNAGVAVAVTGAGGPDPQDGQPPGTVWVAVDTGAQTATRKHTFDGTPPEVCDHAATASVALLLEVLTTADHPLPPLRT